MDVTSHANVVCEPVERRKKPQVVVDAQFSIPYTIAVALIRGKVFIQDFTEAAIADQDVLNLAGKVTTRYDNSLGDRGISPAIVTIVTKNNKVYQKRVDHPRGSFENGMTYEEIVNKFMNCSKFTPNEISAINLKEVVNRVGELEKEKDMTGLMSLFTPVKTKNLT